MLRRDKKNNAGETLASLQKDNQSKEETQKDTVILKPNIIRL